MMCEELRLFTRIQGHCRLDPIRGAQWNSAKRWREGVLLGAQCPKVTLGHPNLISGFLSTPFPDGSVGRREIINIHFNDHDIFVYHILNICVF
jgi:hypothetical protein